MKGTSPFPASPEVKETPITSKLWSRQSKGTKKRILSLLFSDKNKTWKPGKRTRPPLEALYRHHEIIQMSERERDRPADNSIGSSHINLDSFFASFSRRFVFPCGLFCPFFPPHQWSISDGSTMPGRENWTATRFPISEIDKCCWRDMNSEHVLAKERKMVCFRFRSFPSLALNQKNWRLGLDTSLSCFIAFECKPQNNIYHFFHRLASCFLELSCRVWDRV